MRARDGELARFFVDVLALRELLGANNGDFRARRPCVMITGHTGNWELLGYALALLGFPMHALFRPLDIRPFSRWIERTRQRRTADAPTRARGTSSATPGSSPRGPG